MPFFISIPVFTFGLEDTHTHTPIQQQHYILIVRSLGVLSGGRHARPLDEANAFYSWKRAFAISLFSQSLPATPGGYGR